MTKVEHSTDRKDRRTSKRQSSNTFSFTQQQEIRCKKTDVIPDGKLNLQHYLSKLGLPSGLHSAIESVYSSMESRIWVIDNSHDMGVKDCSVMLADDKLEHIMRKEGKSRWEEQLQCVEFHLKMAAR